MIRLLAVISGFLAVGLLTGCYEKMDGKDAGQGPLYRHHFIGMSQVSQGTNATKLKQVWGLTTTAAARQMVLDKLALAPREFWRKDLPANAPDQKELIRPLLDDVPLYETYIDVRGPVGRSEGVLAIRLPKERITAWSANLTKLVQGWNLGVPQQLQAGTAKGWSVKGKDGRGVVQVMTAGDWLLMGIAPERLTLLQPLVDQAAKTGRPVAALAQGNLMVFDADLPRLKTWFPFLASLKMAPAHIEVIGRGENLRTEMRMKFSEKIPWKPEPWKIPTGIISEPLASLTVGQGIGPLLPEIKGVSQLGLKSYPNQFCAWSLSTMHLLNYMSAPVANASNVLKQAGPHLSGFLKQYFPEPYGQIGFASNKSEVVWAGLPFVFPSLQAVRDGGTEYILGGVFPMARKTNTPPPAELLSQFTGRKDLMYYDWEITGQGIIHSRQLLQLTDILNGRSLPPNNDVMLNWTTDLSTNLANTITEVIQSAPNELSLTRKSHIGLTGLELNLLTRWFNSRSFPFGYEPPPKMQVGGRKARAGGTGATNAPPAQRGAPQVPTR